MTSASHGFRTLAVGVLAPLLFAIAGVLVAMALAASGPSVVVTHWGVSGQPNQVGSPYIYPILIATVSVAVIAFLGGSTVLIAHRSPMTPMIKLIGVTSLWVTVFLGVGLAGGLLDQRTVESVRSAGSPALALLAAAVIATLVALGGWFIMPKIVKPTSDDTRVAPVELADGERASWIRTATASRGVLWGFAGVGVLLGGSEILVVLMSAGQWWWFSFIPIAVLALLLSNLAWTVRVDARGVRIRSVLAIPSVSIPLDNIESANIVEVSAFSQYGGWGIRWNLSGRLGIILRSGQALEVHRRKGLTVVITIDDATSAAALINGLLQRRPPAP